MTENPISEHDIAHLVPAFYARVRQDPLLGPIFDGAIDDWPHHLVKLQGFWSSVMLSSGRDKGQPMVAHVRHEESLTAEAFDRWLNLWRQTTDDLLEPAAAAALQEKANRIAESLQLGVRFYRDRKAAWMRDRRQTPSHTSGHQLSAKRRFLKVCSRITRRKKALGG